MKNPSISIVIPVYNSAQYLKRCVDSICRQTFKNFQTVLVDDGSTDGSGEICDQYASLDSRFKVIHQKNAGAVKARKIGTIEADGEYIYYVDSDDWLEENVIEVFSNIVGQYDVDMILIGHKREYENGKYYTSKVPFKNGYYRKSWIRNEMLYQLLDTSKFYESSQSLPLWNYLIRKKILLKNQENVDDRIRILEDAILVYYCLLDADKLYVNKNIYYHYIQHSNSLKRRKDPKEYDKLQLVYKALVSRFIIEPQKDILLKQAKYLLLYTILYSVPGQAKVDGGLFPYTNFSEGSKVVIYGAGAFGKNIFKILNQSQYAEIVGWIDENYTAYQKEGIQVDSPKILQKIEFDYVILGVLMAHIRDDIIQLLKKYHVPKEKIIDIDLNKINNVSLPAEFQNILYEAESAKK